VHSVTEIFEKGSLPFIIVFSETQYCWIIIYLCVPLLFRTLQPFYIYKTYFHQKYSFIYFIFTIFFWLFLNKFLILIFLIRCLLIIVFFLIVIHNITIKFNHSFLSIIDTFLLILLFHFYFMFLKLLIFDQLLFISTCHIHFNLLKIFSLLLYIILHLFPLHPIPYSILL
jgi:hypothetical protein